MQGKVCMGPVAGRQRDGNYFRLSAYSAVSYCNNGRILQLSISLA